MARVTMEDIARAAGVSLATVSRVIHSPHLVSSKTRSQVRRAINEHKYIYHAPAGDLSRKRSRIIGLLVPTTRSPVFARTVLAVQEKCHDMGYGVMLGNTQYDADIERRLLTQFQERRVAGVILTGFSLGRKQVLEELSESGIPTVVIWERLDDPNLGYVGFDNYKAAYNATEYLVYLGHSSIGLIVGPYSKVGRAKKRLDGYRDALIRHGIEYEKGLVAEMEPTLANGELAMKRILGTGRQVTAVFAASDVLAIGAMKAAKAHGLSIPRDLSIMGFDDIDFAAYTDPPLTTVRVATYEIGALAVGSLLEMIKGEAGTAPQYCLDTYLVERESCTRPRDEEEWLETVESLRDDKKRRRERR